MVSAWCSTRLATLAVAASLAIAASLPAAEPEAEYPVAPPIQDEIHLAQAELEPAPPDAADASQPEPRPRPLEDDDPLDLDRPGAELPASMTPPRYSTANQPRPGLFSLLLGGGSAAPGSRLAGVPNMFGDNLGIQADIAFEIDTGEIFVGTAAADLPIAAGSRRVKVSEHNGTLPQDRVHFGYNHFSDALAFGATGLPGTPTFGANPLDRYTLGVEKTFFCGWNSIEVRVPLAGYGEFDREFLGISGGNAGNLSIVFKQLLTRTCTSATVLGVAVDVPTGSDVHGLANFVDFTLHNEAVFVSPFAGMLWTSSERTFHQVFVQLDVPTRGDSVDVFDRFADQAVHLGRLESQTALYLDVQSGYWLYRNPCSWGITGLAFLVESHWTTTTTDADSLSYVSPLQTATLRFGSRANRVDMANVTFGVHAEIGRTTTCRVGAVFPIKDDDDRAFDSEVVVQVEQRF